MNVVFNHDVNQSGTIMKRVAKIDDKFYPYNFSLNTGQVTWGNSFAKHSEFGVKYVSEPCKTLEEAKNKLNI